MLEKPPVFFGLGIYFYIEKSFVFFSGIQQSDSDLFFSDSFIDHYKILNTVPCAIQ